MRTQHIGNMGETAVAALYQKNGYHILKQNYRTRFGEIDLIAQSSDYLVFVEVKTRKAGATISGREAVDYHKQQRMIATAAHYMQQTRKTECFARFYIV